MKAVEQQIQDTGQVGKMTSKEKVLSVYPDAYVAHFNAGMAIKNEANNIFLSDDYTHDSEEDAWDDAASKLPSAPSPAEETARITLSSRPPTQREIERGQELAKQHGLLADAVPTPAEFIDTLYHAERLKFEQWYAANRMQLYMHLDVRLRMAIEDTARAAWFSGMESGSVVAASIAPAAVSETDNAFDTWWDEHKKTEYSSVEYLARCVWNAARAKPSAEGDGWTAGFNAGIDAVIAAENDWNYFPVDMQRIAKLKRVPAPPSGQGEVK